MLYQYYVYMFIILNTSVQQKVNLKVKLIESDPISTSRESCWNGEIHGGKIEKEQNQSAIFFLYLESKSDNEISEPWMLPAMTLLLSRTPSKIGLTGFNVVVRRPKPLKY